MLESMQPALLQAIITSPAVNMSTDVPRDAAADLSAKSKADFAQDPSQAAFESAILPASLLPVVSPAPLHHSPGLADAMQQQGDEGVEEACVQAALPDCNLQVRY